MEQIRLNTGGWSALALAVCSVLSVSEVYAEVVLDSTVQACQPSCNLAGPDYQINAEQGQLHGQNLFHSFQDFNLTSAESATFNGPAAVQNIIGRVTGGNISSIDGTINSTISGANLWLINPAGMVFGANARLNISGSFHASTADYLVLGNDGRFDVTTPENSLLSVSHPSAFGFLNNNIGSITVQSGAQLHVVEGRELSLVGGDISIAGVPGSSFAEASLLASGGRINLLSVASAGEVDISGQMPVLNNFDSLGNIRMSNGAVVSAGGTAAGGIVIRAGKFEVVEGSTISSNTGSDDGAVTAIDVQVTEMIVDASYVYSDSFSSGRAGNVNIDADRLSLLQGGQIYANTEWSGQGGDLNVSARQITIDGVAGQYTGLFANAGYGSSGAAGNLTIHADTLMMDNFGSIQSLGMGSGDVGNTDITVNQLTVKNGSGIYNTGLFGWGVANSGELNITANSILLQGLAQAGSPFVYEATGIFGHSGQGTGNTVRINAGELVLDSRASIQNSSFGAGAGGDIEINVDNLKIQNGSMISANALGAGGSGGMIRITATDTISMSGVHQQPLQDAAGATVLAPSIIATQSGLYGGQAGEMIIKADRFEMHDGARLAAQTFGSADAGNITVEAREVVIDGNNSYYQEFLKTVPASTARSSHTLITSTSNSFFNGEATTGAAGVITISADNLQLSNEAIITTTSDGPGHAGSIRLSATNITVSGDSIVDSESRSTGDAGDISVHATGTLRLDHSLIATEAAAGNGGSIKLQADESLHATGSEITASVAGGDGQGGSIDIKTRDAVLTASKITASSNGTGTAGDIKLVATDALETLGSTISTEATQADGGNISISVQRFIYLDHSAITASVSGGAGNGGNIFIDPELMVIKSSTITANAHGGKGGNVTIIAGNLITSPDSVISASSTLGIDGEVMIDAPIRDLDSDLVLLPENLLDASSLFRNDCAAVGGRYSSFVVSDALQAAGGLLSPAYYVDEQAMQLSRLGDSPRAGDSSENTLAYHRVVDLPRGGCQTGSHVF